MNKFGLIPLRNFGVVDAKKELYRSAQPLHKHDYKWLVSMLGLKNIIDLRAELDRDEKHAQEYNIRISRIPVEDHRIPTLQQVEDFNKLIVQFISAEQPTLIHCDHGHGRTSTFSVLAKIALGATLQDALQQEHHQFHYSWKHPAQLQFLKEYAGVPTS